MGGRCEWAREQLTQSTSWGCTVTWPRWPTVVLPCGIKCNGTFYYFPKHKQYTYLCALSFSNHDVLFLEILAGMINKYLIPKYRTWLYNSENCLLTLLFVRTKFPIWKEGNNWEISCFLLLSSWSSNCNTWKIVIKQISIKHKKFIKVLYNCNPKHFLL